MRKHVLPHPAAVYFVLLVLVIIASWIGSILEMRTATSYSSLVIRSVLSSNGMRWMVSNAAVSLQHTPIGNAVMLFMAVGALHSSGLWSACMRVGRLAPRENASLVIAAVSLLLLVALSVAGMLSGSRLATGLSSGIADSPIGRGAIFILLMAAAVPSIAYGLACGTLQSATDCVEALACMIRPMAHFIVCMLVAGQILDAVAYARLDVFLGIPPGIMHFVSFLLYWLPLPVIMLRDQKKRSNI